MEICEGNSLLLCASQIQSAELVLPFQGVLLDLPAPFSQYDAVFAS